MNIEIDCLTVELSGTRVLDSVSFDVAAGECVGLIGPNGSGKSTLMRCMYRSLTPTSGQVRIGGDDLTTMPRRHGARVVAAVTQHQTGQFGYTAGETVMLGRFPHGDVGTATAERACADALELTDSSDLADRNVLELSGGERQRVLIARALAQGTPVLLMDEPLNHLDVRHQLYLLRLLRDLDKTIVMAIHDMDLAAQSCDRLVLLDKGQVVATGPPSKVLDPERIQSVYGIRPTVAQTADGRPRVSFEL